MLKGARHVSVNRQCTPSEELQAASPLAASLKEKLELCAQGSPGTLIPTSLPQQFM